MVHSNSGVFEKYLVGHPYVLINNRVKTRAFGGRAAMLATKCFTSEAVVLICKKPSVSSSRARLYSAGGSSVDDVCVTLLIAAVNQDPQPLSKTDSMARPLPSVNVTLLWFAHTAGKIDLCLICHIICPKMSRQAHSTTTVTVSHYCCRSSKSSFRLVRRSTRYDCGLKGIQAIYQQRFALTYTKCIRHRELYHHRDG